MKYSVIIQRDVFELQCVIINNYSLYYIGIYLSNELIMISAFNTITYLLDKLQA